MAKHHICPKYISRYFKLEEKYPENLSKNILDDSPTMILSNPEHVNIHTLIYSKGLATNDPITLDRNITTQLEEAGKQVTTASKNRLILNLLKQTYNDQGNSDAGELAVAWYEQKMKLAGIDLDPP